jgi:murein DD-endopeptidase MepM/ murein hydrolase activator NlpD
MKKYLAEVLLVSVSAILLVLIILKSDFSSRPEENDIAEEMVVEPVLKFGLPVDSFQVESGIVRRNQNLSDILCGKGVSYYDIDCIARRSKPLFDVRKIKYKNPYYFFLKNDSSRSPVYFIYEIDPVEYMVYQLNDSLHVYKGAKPTSTVLRTASGKIKSSLWNAMTGNDINPVLALELSDIYAWTIDFFAIRKGDQFRVIYEENYVDSVSVGIGKIYAVLFHHIQDDYYAFLFDQDGRESYFDESGKSLKKAFRKAPLHFSRISSRFSYSRFHPILRIRRPHLGIDYAAPGGTPVVSIGDGVVTRKGYQAGGGGNYLYIKHNSVYTTCYMHLRGYAKGIAPGVRVKQGQRIGYVGKTGLASGPHLDFRVFRNGSPMDPLKVKSPPVEPVKQEYMPEFTALKDSLIRELQKISLN